MTSPDPGWYPDPEDEGRLRYWDGAAWTDRTGEREAIAQGPPAPGQGPRPGQQPWWRQPITIAGALAVVVALAAGFLVLSGGQAEAEVILEPTAAAGSDPFTESVASDAVGELVSASSELAGDPVEGISGGDRSIESIEGAAPGLYGGTEKEAACDPEAMVAFLEQSPDKAKAFAGPLGIEPKRIDKYVAGLTPVVLREDTRVTNHGFEAGQATPFEAVLQAGTAVMVDDRGVPRVRCACGNPLAEPTASETQAEFSGEAWDGFDQQRLVAVAPARERVESLELVDVETGEAYEQRLAGGGLTVEELLNLRMPPVAWAGDPDNPVLPAAKWRDGVHPDTNPGFEANGASIAGIDMDGNRVQGSDVQAAVGDLTGDGRDDGVVAREMFSCGASCAESFDVVAFDSSGEVLEVLYGGLPDVDSFGSVENLRVVDGGIELTAGVYTGDEAGADGPSLEVPLRFEWNGSEFEEVQ